jgi:hypothetical protein
MTEQGPFKNPVVVPTVLHVIIPCILLWTKTYEISVLFFTLVFSLSLLRAVITISFLCKEDDVNRRLSYLVLFIDLVIVAVYLVFSVMSSDPLIAVFALIYMMGFIWVAQEVRTYLRNFTALSQEEEVVVSVDDGTECCICYEGIVEGKMLSCGHIYHKECIDEWFKEKRICPYCRHKVDDCRAQAR